MAPVAGDRVRGPQPAGPCFDPVAAFGTCPYQANQSEALGPPPARENGTARQRTHDPRRMGRQDAHHRCDHEASCHDPQGSSDPPSLGAGSQMRGGRRGVESEEHEARFGNDRLVLNRLLGVGMHALEVRVYRGRGTRRENVRYVVTCSQQQRTPMRASPPGQRPATCVRSQRLAGP